MFTGRFKRKLFRSRNAEAEDREWTEEEIAAFFENKPKLRTFEDLLSDIFRQYDSNSEIVEDAIRKYGPPVDKNDLIQKTRRFMHSYAYDHNIEFSGRTEMFIRYDTMGFVKEYLESHSLKI